MDTKIELEDLMRRERRNWIKIDGLVDMMNDKNCPELEADFRRLKFFLRKVKNTDDYEFYFNELCCETNQDTVKNFKTDNIENDVSATNPKRDEIPQNSVNVRTEKTSTGTVDLTFQTSSASVEETAQKLKEKPTENNKKYIRYFTTSESESEMKTMPKPKRTKKDETNRRRVPGRPKKKSNLITPRNSKEHFASKFGDNMPPLEDIPNSRDSISNSDKPAFVSPKRMITMQSTSGAEVEQDQVNPSVYESAKEILSSQQTQSPASAKVKRKRGRPKGSKSTPKSTTPKTDSTKSKRIAKIQLEKEGKELSDDDRSILDILTEELKQ